MTFEIFFNTCRYSSSGTDQEIPASIRKTNRTVYSAKTRVLAEYTAYTIRFGGRLSDRAAGGAIGAGRCNKKISKKKLCRYGNSRILIARQHFSMVLLWGQLHRDFLRFVNWTRASGRHGNFYQVAQGQHPLLCALSTTESLSCPKSIGSIGGNPIFWGQQYSSCSKAGGCQAAQLLGGFLKNLLIVSWVTSTPGCTVNFPVNSCSQPLDLWSLVTFYNSKYGHTNHHTKRHFRGETLE